MKCNIPPRVPTQFGCSLLTAPSPQVFHGEEVRRPDGAGQDREAVQQAAGLLGGGVDGGRAGRPTRPPCPAQSRGEAVSGCRRGGAEVVAAEQRVLVPV